MFNLLAAIAAVSGFAANPCELVADVEDRAVSVEYWPGDPDDVERPFALGLENEDSRICFVRVDLQPLTGEELVLRSPRGDELPVTIELPNGIVLQRRLSVAFPDLLVLAAGENRDLELKVVIPARQFRPAGTYSAQVDLEIRTFAGDVAAPPPVAPDQTIRLDIVAVIEPFVTIGRVNSGFGDTEETLSFGELEVGEETGTNLQVLANAPFRVTVSSENRSRLAHERSGATVPYEATVNDQPIALAAGPVTLDSATGLPSPLTLYRFEFEILPFDQAPAGQYGDVVDLRVEVAY